MRFTTVIAAVAALISSVVFAVPTRTTQFNVHERRERKPLMWERGERVQREVILPVRIGLTQRNLDLGVGLLEEV